MVAMSPTKALTAAHCVPAEMPAKWIGVDVVELSGHFPPPYARRGGRIEDHLLVEGYGCDPGTAWFVVVPVRRVRTALYVGPTMWPGLDIAIQGRVCGGDSGGALWNDHGNLVGILTGRATGAFEGFLGFAAGLPSGVP
jgi:hypothetical protein